MKCLSCGAEDIEKDDNFCYNCGHWTTKGYSFLKDEKNINTIKKGAIFKQNTRIGFLLVLLSIGIISFISMLAIRGNNLFAPFTYLKKQFTNYVYGYNTSIIKTDNKYSNVEISDYNEAIEFIKKDFQEQSYICNKDADVSLIETNLQNNYSIPNVSFCDITKIEAEKIKNVVTKMYDLFPNIKDGLTNITITNANTKEEYIARFQPMYQFVNINENIKDYNKINKTQILLNSYYFLNEEKLNRPLTDIIKDNWYVKDATFESTIAHEMGHYISFVLLLKEYNLNNITFVTKDNYKIFDNIIEEYENNVLSNKLLDDSINNYNKKYNIYTSKEEFAKTISDYAAIKDKKGNINAEEVIAEAIHDYFLHGNNMQKSSHEIVSIIKDKLGM